MSDAFKSGYEPAFPCEVLGTDEQGEYRSAWQGMTLRDYFAAKVMVRAIEQWKNCDAQEDDGGVFNWYAIDGDEPPPRDCISAAELAYAMADAMLEARKI